jgi:hypothetical protein
MNVFVTALGKHGVCSDWSTTCVRCVLAQTLRGKNNGACEHAPYGESGACGLGG